MEGPPSLTHQYYLPIPNTSFMEKYNMAAVSLEIEEESSYYILLTNEGTIYRKGDGMYKAKRKGGSVGRINGLATKKY
jgi:hypothetical protein